MFELYKNSPLPGVEGEKKTADCWWICKTAMRAPQGNTRAKRAAGHCAPVLHSSSLQNAMATKMPIWGAIWKCNCAGSEQSLVHPHKLINRGETGAVGNFNPKLNRGGTKTLVTKPINEREQRSFGGVVPFRGLPTLPHAHVESLKLATLCADTSCLDTKMQTWNNVYHIFEDTALHVSLPD